MEMRRMVRRRRLLAAEAAAAVISLLVFVLSTDLASNVGSHSAVMAPKVFCAKNSRYGSKLHVRDSCGDPGTAHGVLALVQRYTAKLSSMLTAKRFQPWVIELYQLLMNGDYIGCQTQTEGFVCSFLMKKGIKEDRLNPYNNQTEYCKALSKGSNNGGGSATVDEIPYFRSDEHSKTYEMVVDIPYRTPGHGFVSPKTSPLAHDVCVDSILDIAEGCCVEQWVCTVTYIEGVPACSSLEPAHNDSKPPIQWIFLKPLTKELWLATVCFIFFTGFVFWTIERSINPVFQGSSLAQFSTALYFVFSTFTFSHVLVLVQSYVANLSSMLAAEASANHGSSSAAGSAPLTLRSFYGLFVVTGCISALMLLTSLTRSAYAAYTRVRGSESRSTPQNDAANGSVVPEQPVQGVRDNDSQGAHVSSAISRDEAAGVVRDSISNASEPAPDVYVQIEMTSTSNGVGGAL